MRQLQDDTITMFETTLSILGNNERIWKDTRAFTNAVERAKTGTAALRNKMGKQQAPTGGATDEKAQLRDDLETKLLVLAGAISALAAKNSDPALAAKVEMNRSSLDRLAASELVQTAKRVREAATENLAALADYDITAATGDELKAAEDLFASKKDAPREAQVERKVETLSIPEGISSVRSIFRNEIDKMMIRYRKSEADFYKAYAAARMIVNRSATRTPKSTETSPTAPAPSPAPSPAPPK
jgi:hypothetical protein